MAISNKPTSVKSSGSSKDSAPPYRTLRHFESPKEVLHAIRDAIMVNQDVWDATHVPHGNVSLDTICFQATAPTGERGFLIDVDASSKPNGDPVFHSVNSLSRDLYPEDPNVSIDYLDDLESFYYVLAYIPIAFTGPSTKHPTLPHVLQSWVSTPSSKEAVLEKEAMITGYGIEAGHTDPYFSSYVFETLLDDWQTILRYRFEQKAALERPRTTEQLERDSKEDYEDFLERIDWFIDLVEQFGEVEVSEIDKRMNTFQLDQ
ncbi:hypothetical protein B0H34DRAFT_669807 [Crassisporium funariophilum]|nr:hypothetical protein B0H34DRAFT_669807 [Crassisporium funariophilum]